MGEAGPGATAPAICSTGFCTWVDLTDCMMMGEWVFPWRYMAMEEDRLEPDRMEETGLGQAGIGEAAVLGPRLAAPWENWTLG